MGRRPYLSLRFPMPGENKNCVIAKTDNRKAPYVLAILTGIPLSSAIKSAITGMISPHPITSISNVTKIKPMAARLDVRMLKAHKKACNNTDNFFFCTFIGMSKFTANTDSKQAFAAGKSGCACCATEEPAIGNPETNPSNGNQRSQNTGLQKQYLSMFMPAAFSFVLIVAGIALDNH